MFYATLDSGCKVCRPVKVKNIHSSSLNSSFSLFLHLSSTKHKSSTHTVSVSKERSPFCTDTSHFSGHTILKTLSKKIKVSEDDFHRTMGKRFSPYLWLQSWYSELIQGDIGEKLVHHPQTQTHVHAELGGNVIKLISMVPWKFYQPPYIFNFSLALYKQSW